MKYCSYCGKQNKDTAKFCPYCGKQMADPVNVQQAQQFQQPQQSQQPQYCFQQFAPNQAVQKSKPIYKKPWFIILCVAWVLFVLFVVCTVDVDDTENRLSLESSISSTYTSIETTTEATTEPKTEAPKDFLSELCTVLDSNVAEKANNILLNDIGFEKLEYDGIVSDGLTNYYIIADDYLITLTASDDVYRIFTGDFVLYEDGTVKLTKSQLKDREITSSDSNKYYIIAKEIVSQYLNNPKSAEFPSLITQDGVGMARRGNLVAVSGWVYAENSFGATIKNDWLVQFSVIDLNSYEYSIEYVQIGDDAFGQYVEFSE